MINRDLTFCPQYDKMHFICQLTIPDGWTTRAAISAKMFGPNFYKIFHGSKI